MQARYRHPGIAACAALAAVLAATSCGHGAAQTGTLPRVAVAFPDEPFERLFRRDPRSGEPEQVTVAFTDIDGTQGEAKARLRGLSAWHHGAEKPSLRIKPKASAERVGPAYVELSRPEDPLALCNWLPDQLADELGLLHERSQLVHLQLDGRNGGVYLRSLRPDDDLAAASGRARGTFWKGDSLGERLHQDLWAGTDAWRHSGADDPRARAALETLLASLRQELSPASLAQLRGVLDVEAAARAAAVAVLVGSIHADRVHNHVLFHDPLRGRLETLLWDSNGFGIHAEPTLPIEVARHPLAERLLCDPWFVHRRNELLWGLLHGSGSAAALLARADQHLHRLSPALAADPQPGRLRLERGKFVLQPVAAADLPAARAEFEHFVQRRDAWLRAHFAGVAAAFAADEARPGCTRITVFGNVAVRVRRADGRPATTPEGRPVSLLLPGLSLELAAADQHRGADGRGVPAPHALPAPLHYTVAGAPTDLRLFHAFTDEPVAPAEPPAATRMTRSVHPWSIEAPGPTSVVLGPGDVTVDTMLVVEPGSTLAIAPGTNLVFADGCGIRCRGDLLANGTEAAPVAVRWRGAFGGIACFGSSRVRLDHVHVENPNDWRPSPGSVLPLLSLHDCRDAVVAHSRFVRAAGTALEVRGGALHLHDGSVQQARGVGLFAADGAKVEAVGGRFAFADTGVVARDGASVHLRRTQLRGNLTGARAERTVRPFRGGTIVLEQVDCRDNGQGDVDGDATGTIELVGTPARARDGAAVQLAVRPEPAGLAAPR